MSISSSLNAGVAGLAANATRLAGISDNIANSGTYGYKRVNTDFESMVINQARGDVKLAQQRLNAHGADLAVDGHFGPLTEAATKAFQAHKGLSADGQVGKNTQRALRS